MDALHYVLMALALLLGSAFVWMLNAKGRHAARAAGAEARAHAAEAERARAECQGEERAREGARLLAERESDVERLEAALNERVVECTRLMGEIDADRARHDAELRRQADLAAEQARSLEDREATFRAEIGRRELAMRDTFRSLAAESLSASSADFLKLAEQRLSAQRQAHEAELDARKAAVEQLLKPIGESLARADATLAEMGKAMAGDKGALVEQLKASASASEGLRAETGRLARALREPAVRGRYGELQLKRVAELAGMASYCDFSTQDRARDDSGAHAVPDMVVRLPNQRVVIVDAKTNIQAYLDAQQTPDQADAHLDRHASNVARQAADLAKRRYWALPDYAGSPEFVVMFLPGDAFLDAALARRPDLLDQAASQNVLIATPASLIAMLRAVAVGYREQRLAKAAEELRDLGRELHERASTAFGHAAKLGAALEATVRRYNEFVASYESRLEPTLRRFEETGVKGARDIPDLPQVDVRPRALAPATTPEKLF